MVDQDNTAQSQVRVREARSPPSTLYRPGRVDTISIDLSLLMARVGMKDGRFIILLHHISHNVS
jgi:hypothetical protein